MSSFKECPESRDLCLLNGLETLLSDSSYCIDSVEVDRERDSSSLSICLRRGSDVRVVTVDMAVNNLTATLDKLKRDVMLAASQLAVWPNLLRAE